MSRIRTRSFDQTSAGPLRSLVTRFAAALGFTTSAQDERALVADAIRAMRDEPRPSRADRSHAAAEAFGRYARGLH